MKKYSFVFQKTVYLRQEVKADSYDEAEEIVLALPEHIGELYDSDFYLASVDCRDVAPEKLLC